MLLVLMVALGHVAGAAFGRREGQSAHLADSSSWPRTNNRAQSSKAHLHLPRMASQAEPTTSSATAAFVQKMEESVNYGECGNVFLYKHFGMVCLLEMADPVGGGKSGSTATVGVEHHITIT